VRVPWFASAFDNDDVPYRILVMVIMGGELMFAGGVGYFFDTLDFSIGIVGWVVMRVGMVGLWLRAAAGSTEYRTTCLRYALGITLAQIGWVVFFLLASRGGTDFFLWGTVVFLIEFSVPVWAENARATPFHRHHIIERYGLLMIISLGEILLPISIGFGSIAEGDGSGAILVALRADGRLARALGQQRADLTKPGCEVTLPALAPARGRARQAGRAGEWP
jgi:low temperature requirement protein LtrA